MLYIRTQDGQFLDIDDSKRYISYDLQNKFSSIDEFYFCYEFIMSSYYWGDCVLKGSEDDYKLWIIDIAKDVLNK